MVARFKPARAHLPYALCVRVPMASSVPASTGGLKTIQDLQCGQKLAHLLGVVTSFRPPAKSRGKDFFCSLELVDETEKQIKCVIFGSESTLPQQCPVGSVVCFKKVSIEDYHGSVQLSAHSKLSYWAILEEKGDGSIDVSAANNDSVVTLSDVERQRARVLKEWVEQTNLVPGPSTSTVAASSLLPIGGRVCPPTSSRYYGAELRPINQLILGMRNVGLIGLVKFYKPPSESRGRDCYIIVHIVDESSPSNGITCLIFNPSKDKLAIMGRVGAVAIVKGVRIETQRDTGNLQAFGHEHALVGVFAGAESGVIPNQIGTWYDLTSAEKKRVAELRSWAKKEGPLLLNSRLEEVTPGHYFNTMCQVVAMAVLQEQRRAVLSVVDGTSSKMPLRGLNLAKFKQNWEFDSIPELYYAYRLITHDIWVVNIAHLDVEAGDVVNLMNVFSYQIPSRQPVQGTAMVVDPPLVELRLIDQEDSMVHFDKDSQEAIKFKESLPVMHGVFPSWRAPDLSDLDDESEDAVCTIVDESTPQATLEEIKNAKNGSEFLADVEVKLIKPGSLDDIISCNPICPSCGDGDSEVQDENGKNITRCLKDGATPRYELSFSLLLSDGSGELEVAVSGTESQRLFSKILTPDDLATSRETKEKILDIFYKLTGGNDPFFAVPADPRYSYIRPTLQCGIKKIVNPSGGSNGEVWSYSLVNTIIDQSEQI